MIRSCYIRQHLLRFQSGRSHKDILWTVHLATCNGRFCVSDIKDYLYIRNTASITHRPDYYDVRAMSYIEVIADIIRLSGLEANRTIYRYLYRHALVETRHLLGLYRNKVQDKVAVRIYFRKNITLNRLTRGIYSISDAWFFIKLKGKLR
jgi:hypothetical protein